MRWAQPEDTGGDVSSYSWRLVKGSSQVYNGSTGETSASQSGVPSGTYQLYVSATGKGGTGPEAGPVEVTVKDPPPPPPKNPSGSISQGSGPATCTDGGSCYHVKINWSDFEAGSYRLDLFQDGAVVSSLNAVNTDGSGSAEFQRIYGKTSYSLFVRFTRASDGKTWDVAQTNGTDWR